MDSYDIITNQPVVIDNVSEMHGCYLLAKFQYF